MGRVLAVIALLTPGCGGGTVRAPAPSNTPAPAAIPIAAVGRRPDAGPTCAEAFRTLMRRFTADQGASVSDEIMAQLVAKCEDDGWDADTRLCMVTATDARESIRCTFEAVRYLKRLNLAADRYFDAHGAFPMGTSGPIPSQPCCSFSQGRCPSDAPGWQGPPWSDLGFTIEHAHDFQFSYRSDGKTYTAEAVGDLRCDGDPKDFTLQGDASTGSPTSALTSPASGP